MSFSGTYTTRSNKDNSVLIRNLNKVWYFPEVQFDPLCLSLPHLVCLLQDSFISCSLILIQRAEVIMSQKCTGVSC